MAACNNWYEVGRQTQKRPRLKAFKRWPKTRPCAVWNLRAYTLCSPNPHPTRFLPPRHYLHPTWLPSQLRYEYITWGRWWLVSHHSSNQPHYTGCTTDHLRDGENEANAICASLRTTFNHISGWVLPSFFVFFSPKKCGKGLMWRHWRELELKRKPICPMLVFKRVMGECAKSTAA